jgi:hypothetical protein
VDESHDLQILQDRFSSLDRDLIENIFTSTKYDLETSIGFLQQIVTPFFFFILASLFFDGFSC